MKFWASMAFSPPEHYLPLAKAADEAGVHGIMMSDHIFYPRDLATPYPYTTDGAPIWPPDGVARQLGGDRRDGGGDRAAAVRHVGLRAPVRDPFTVAKEVGTAAVLSGNRVNLGVGAGWMREEFEQTGQPYGNRGAHDEMIPAMRKLWSGGWSSTTASTTIRAVQIEPRPPRPGADLVRRPLRRRRCAGPRASATAGSATRIDRRL